MRPSYGGSNKEQIKGGPTPDLLASVPDGPERLVQQMWQLQGG
jgi:hypothetical protein